MTKAELIEAVAKQCNISPTEAESAVDIFLEHMVDSLEKGEKVELDSHNFRTKSSKVTRQATHQSQVSNFGKNFLNGLVRYKAVSASK